MPQYVSPGVYIEEIETSPRPIEGVSEFPHRLTLDSLVLQLREIVQHYEPEWSDLNSDDPGITLVELVTFLADALLYQITPSEEGRQAALRALASLSKFASSCDPATLTRPNFFEGQILGAEDLQAEQQYHRQKQRIHNRSLHGFGIVSGLEVGIEENYICISPGYALDSKGEEIVLCSRVTIQLPKSLVQAFVSVRYFEVLCCPVSSGTDGPKFYRVNEACVLALGEKVPDAAIALARVLFSDGQWVVDPEFNPARVS